MVKEQVYYQKNVNYNIGVRMYPGDKDGVVLTGAEPVVAVDVENIRPFKQANKRIIIEGLLIETPEPNLDWELNNSLSDEDIVELVKSHLKLKSKLPGISSLPILYKMQEEAKGQERAKRILDMIQERIDALEDNNDMIERSEERGVE